MLTFDGISALLRKAWQGAAGMLALTLLSEVFLRLVVPDIPGSAPGKDLVLDWLKANLARGLGAGAFVLALQTFGMMGYWGCLAGARAGGEAGLRTFFGSGAKLFGRGLAGQVLMVVVSGAPLAAAIGLMLLARAGGKPYSVLTFFFVLMMVPAVIYFFWAAVRLSLWLPEMFLNGAGAAGALRGSYAVTDGNFWRILFVGMVPSIAANLVSGAGFIPGAVMAGRFLKDYALPVVMPAVLLLLFLELTAPAKAAPEPPAA